MKKIALILGFSMILNSITCQEPYLVKDVETDPAGSNPSRLLAAGNTIYFTANDGITNGGLWKSTGTEPGTVKIEHDELLSASPMAVMNNTLFFLGADKTHGLELWKTDGTGAGAQLVKDIHPGPGRSLLADNEIAVLNDLVLFEANDGLHGNELWRSDGTLAGTFLVKDINEGVPGSSLDHFTVHNDLLYFKALTPETGAELWRSDGTADGTFMIDNIFSGSNSGITVSFEGISVGDLFYFTATDRFGYQSTGVWESDGTTFGTRRIKEVLSARGLVNLNEMLYFFSYDSLWRSDGTIEGTFSVTKVDYQYQGINRIGPMVSGDHFFFTATDPLHGRELWKSDGTAEGTAHVKDINPGTPGSSPTLLTSINDILFFTANNGMNGVELWKTDGTEEGTVMVRDFDPGEGHGMINTSFARMGDRIYFSATSDQTGKELWMSDGTGEGTILVKDINPETTGSSVSTGFDLFQDKLVFSKGLQRKLWITDGTENGTVLLSGDLTGIHSVTSLNNELLLFPALYGETGTELWKSSGFPGTALPVKDIQPGNGSGLDFSLGSFPVLNGVMIFPADNGVSGSELWKTDGTLSGTELIKDIFPGESGSLYTPGFSTYGTGVTIFQDRLFFKADDGVHGEEIWYTDGTGEGTRMLKDLNTGPASGFGGLFTQVGNTLFFGARLDSTGWELWKTDGTETGTELIMDINPGAANGLVNNIGADFMVDLNGTLLFTGNDGSTGYELWKSDGTSEGTVIVRDIRFGAEGSSPEDYVQTGNYVMFIADDGQNGRRVWMSDGTETGTVMIAEDIDFDNTIDLTKANGPMFFISETGEHGKELWRTDGTSEGTIRMTDILPGPAGSVVEIVTYTNGILYFTADDDRYGPELWAIRALEMSVSLEADPAIICERGDTVSFTAMAVNTGSDPRYRWFINDELLEDHTDAVLVTDSLSGGDTVKVEVIAGKDVWILNDSVSAEVIVPSGPAEPEILVNGDTLTATEGVSYTWFLNGILLSVDTRSIVATESGLYRVVVTDSRGCEGSSEEIEVSVSVGTGSGELAGKIRLYPNPASSLLYIESQLSEPLRVIMTTIRGDLVLEENLARGTAHHEINLDGMAPGIYLITITGESDSVRIKLVKR